jgi:hypothetical protein
MRLEGYVIVPPLNPWNENNKDKIIPHMSYDTFSLTPAQAWSKHTRKDIRDIDFPIMVQRWHDRGYRVKKAFIGIDYAENSDSLF